MHIASCQVRSRAHLLVECRKLAYFHVEQLDKSPYLGPLGVFLSHIQASTFLCYKLLLCHRASCRRGNLSKDGVGCKGKRADGIFAKSNQSKQTGSSFCSVRCELSKSNTLACLSGCFGESYYLQKRDEHFTDGHTKNCRMGRYKFSPTYRY